VTLDMVKETHWLTANNAHTKYFQIKIFV